MEKYTLQEDIVDEYIESNDIEREIQECIVCFEPFDINISTLQKYKFNHCTPVSLHTKCFLQWVSENRNSCIVCRHLITDGPEYHNISLLMRLQSFIQEQNHIEIHSIETQPNNLLCKSKRVVFLFLFFFLFTLLLFYCYII